MAPTIFTTFTTTNGGWDDTFCNPAPSSYGYQWKRDGAAISGATSTSYVASDADVGHVLRVTVTGCNFDDCTAVDSSNSVKILESPLGLRRQYTYDAEQSMTDQESLRVNVANGNLVLKADDFHLPGVAGFDLDYSRYYNSLYDSLSTLTNPLLAPGWESMPDLRFFPSGDVRYSGESGFEVTFVKSGTNYLSTPGIDATLVKQGDNTYLLTFHQTGVKVSWLVTGIRHDRYANKHRGPVEVQKPTKEQGKYLHPELYGKPKAEGIGYHKARRAPARPSQRR